MKLLELLTELKKHKGTAGADAQFNNAFELIYKIDRSVLKFRMKRLEFLLNLKFNKSTTKKSKSQWNGKKSFLVGKAFEQVTLSLLDTNFFIIKPNARTGSGEIDSLLTVNLAEAFLTKQFSNGENVLCEAKCHAGIIMESHWVSRLHGLMKTHGSRTSLIFSFGKSGVVPSDSRVQMYAAWLSDKLLVIPLGRKQVDEIISGKSFLSVVNDQGGGVEANLLNLSI